MFKIESPLFSFYGVIISPFKTFDILKKYSFKAYQNQRNSMAKKKTLIFGIALVLLFTGIALATSNSLSTSSDVEIYAFDKNPATSNEGNECLTFHNPSNQSVDIVIGILTLVAVLMFGIVPYIVKYRRRPKLGVQPYQNLDYKTRINRLGFQVRNTGKETAKNVSGDHGSGAISWEPNILRGEKPIDLHLGQGIPFGKDSVNIPPGKYYSRYFFVWYLHEGDKWPQREGIITLYWDYSKTCKVKYKYSITREHVMSVVPLNKWWKFCAGEDIKDTDEFKF